PPEGVTTHLGEHPLSPDDRFIAVRHNDGLLYVHPTAGGPGVVVPDSRKLLIARWTPDGRGMLVYDQTLPAHVFRLDVATGRRELRKILMPVDPAGVVTVYSVQVAANEQTYFYSYIRDLTDLYLIQGLR